MTEYQTFRNCTNTFINVYDKFSENEEYVHNEILLHRPEFKMR